jgi:hypothetical protein
VINTHDHLREAGILGAFGAVGWAYCGSIVGIGRQFLSIDTTMIIHAIGAPVGFAILSWVYRRRFGSTSPLATAAIFLGIVILLDVFLVALIFERSFAMFGSFIGTWLPFLLIFFAKHAAGVLGNRKTQPS